MKFIFTRRIKLLIGLVPHDRCLSVQQGKFAFIPSVRAVGADEVSRGGRGRETCPYTFGNPFDYFIICKTVTLTEVSLSEIYSKSNFEQDLLA